MSKRVIDGIIKDWGERLHYPAVRGSKGKNIRGGGSTTAAKASAPSGPATYEKVARTAKKTPEVMVKISGGGKNMKHIKAHMDYISRNGGVEIEDENGDIHHGMEAVRDVRDSWAKGKICIPYDGEKRKEAFNIVLSMPPGTDRQAVKDAARNFAKEQFSNHQYVFAAHDDEKHPHVHLAVKAVGHDGIRLNPRKGDLQYWRELFAEKLRDQGIEANATPRRARGIVQKAEKQAVLHIDSEFKQGKRKAPARVTQVQRYDAEAEIKTGLRRINPAQDKIKAARKETQKAYGKIARVLATGEAADKEVALDIVQLVKSMPPAITKHQSMVQKLRADGQKRPELEPEHTQTPEQGRAVPDTGKSR
ncbi:relaxase/mobilization nuclease domain-containing protein [Microvirgula aerodenitrificans]|uniref:relaxase/mobilization nuclease domain-containing protein n=1 Tax=Microvirgula aerodenitrificans TaxID=57480 RepID=UPI00248F064C|nr:relaxase/mobilization nuclease domain-containing protein [Microvirgula aerodenitrificans]